MVRLDTSSMYVRAGFTQQAMRRQTDRGHTWRVLGEAYADLVEAVPEGVHHLRDPLVPPLERPQVGDVGQALGAALVLPETLRRAAPAERVIAREHHRIFQDTANESAGGGGNEGGIYMHGRGVKVCPSAIWKMVRGGGPFFESCGE